MQRRHRRDAQRDGQRSVRRPEHSFRCDARKHELLPRHAERHPIDTEAAAFEARSIGDLRVRRNQRPIDVEPSRDLGRVNADPGPVTDQGPAVDGDLQVQSASVYDATFRRRT